MTVLFPLPKIYSTLYQWKSTLTRIRRLKTPFSFFHLPYGQPYKRVYKAQDVALLFIDPSGSSVVWSEYLLVRLKCKGRFCCSSLLLTVNDKGSLAGTEEGHTFDCDSKARQIFRFGLNTFHQSELTGLIKENICPNILKYFENSLLWSFK